MNITIQCFGAFRSFGEALTLSLTEGATVSDIRAALTKKLAGQEALIASSRFATETEILPETASLEGGAVIAIIPPVSGG